MAFVCWPPRLLMRSQLMSYLRTLLCDEWLLSLLSRSAFASLIMMCLSLGPFEFILTPVHWASWMFYSCLSSDRGSLLPLVLEMFSRFSWDSHNASVGPLDGGPRVPEALFPFLQSCFCLLFSPSNFHCPIFKFTDSFFWAPICLWIPLVSFPSQLLYF